MTIEDNIKLPFLYASPDKKGVREIEDFDTIISAIEIRPILKKKPQIILADEPTASLDVNPS